MPQKVLFHPVRKYDRLSYLVESASVPGVEYIVDLEGYGEDTAVCSCPAFIQGGKRLCSHIRSVAIYI